MGPGDPLTGSIVSTTDSLGASQPAGVFAPVLLLNGLVDALSAVNGSPEASPLMMY